VLNQDIVVRPHDGVLDSRVTIFGDGTAQYAQQTRFGPQRYRAGAFLPRGASRSATADEIAALDGRGGARGRNHTIGIVRVPQDLVGALRDARSGEGQIPPASLRAFPFDRLPAAIAPGWRMTGDMLALGYGRNPVGFHTVTYDGVGECFIGLHIDDLDAMPLARRMESTSRLCVNLGAGTRYLLFVNLGVSSLVARLAESEPGVDFGALRSTPLIHAFMQRFPNYPVVRLAVHPGEAYIAPTENMIHDGSTAGMTARDDQVTVRGGFDPT
jgi:hypothetical protein